MKYLLMVVLLGLPIPAYADWSAAQVHPGLAPNFVPIQGRPIHNELRVNVTPTQRVEPQHRDTPKQHQPVRHDQPVKRDQGKDHRRPNIPGYFRRDVNYYRQDQVDFPVADVDTNFVVPDGFEVVMVNGETFYYNQGVFYQQVDDQFIEIPAVLGAVVDSIPEDYQIVMADGVHYLVTGGVYYQRVDQGFEVVNPPMVQDS